MNEIAGLQADLQQVNNLCFTQRNELLAMRRNYDEASGRARWCCCAVRGMLCSKAATLRAPLRPRRRALSCSLPLLLLVTMLRPLCGCVHS